MGRRGGGITRARVYWSSSLHETLFSSPSSSSSRLSKHTHHFAGVFVPDGDVGVLHGDVLLDKLALGLGLGRVAGGSLGLRHRVEDDGTASLDNLIGASSEAGLSRDS